MPLRVELRPLGRQCNQPARNTLPIHHRRRPFDNIDTFQEPGINLQSIVGATVTQ